jgi:hypothetical protein
VLHFLQQHQIGVMPENLGDSHIEVYRGGIIGTGFIPTLPELHVELQDFERTHKRGWIIADVRMVAETGNP